MQHLKFVVRWTDGEGKDHSREYDTEKDARKAKDWLTDNGATSVDIAISMNGRETKTAEPSAMFPTKEPPSQQGFSL
jgi:hypothetical protein